MVQRPLKGLLRLPLDAQRERLYVAALAFRTALRDAFAGSRGAELLRPEFAAYRVKAGARGVSQGEIGIGRDRKVQRRVSARPGRQQEVDTLAIMAGGSI
jgi:hypothetical protein